MLNIPVLNPLALQTEHLNGCVVINSRSVNRVVNKENGSVSPSVSCEIERCEINAAWKRHISKECKAITQIVSPTKSINPSLLIRCVCVCSRAAVSVLQKTDVCVCLVLSFRNGWFINMRRLEWQYEGVTRRCKGIKRMWLTGHGRRRYVSVIVHLSSQLMRSLTTQRRSSSCSRKLKHTVED